MTLIQFCFYRPKSDVFEHPTPERTPAPPRIRVESARARNSLSGRNYPPKCEKRPKNRRILIRFCMDICAQRVCQSGASVISYYGAQKAKELARFLFFLRGYARNARVRAMRPQLVLKCAKC